MYTIKQLALLSGVMAFAVNSSKAAIDALQITQTANRINVFTNLLHSDLTGDGNDDITIGGTSQSFGPQNVEVGATINLNSVSADVQVIDFGGGIVELSMSADPAFASGGVGSAAVVGSPTPLSLFYLNPITFMDSRIHDGRPTDGWLETRAYANGTIVDAELGIYNMDAGVVLTRLIFSADTTVRPGYVSIPGTLPEWVAPVPEPSAMALLLAVGAVGLMRRRR